MDRLYNFNSQILALFLLSAFFVLLDQFSAPKIQVAIEMEELGDLTSLVPYMPFYAAAPSFILMNLIVMGLFMIAKNVFKYVKFGVTAPNDYYTTSDTLKIGAFFLTLLAGELLFLGLMGVFYTS